MKCPHCGQYFEPDEEDAHYIRTTTVTNTDVPPPDNIGDVWRDYAEYSLTQEAKGKPLHLCGMRVIYKDA